MTSALFVLIGAFAFVLGLRGSVRLSQRYRSVTARLVWSERLLFAAIIVVAWLVTVTGAVLVILTTRRLAGFAPFDWQPFLVLLLAEAILFIPAFFDYIVGRVARVPWK